MTASGRWERVALGVVAGLLVLVLIGLRGGLHPGAPMERLARQSLPLATALADGRPTIVEFYADWCEACRAMAPAMEQLEQRHHGSLDVVLLNVDNPSWEPELERYEVNGIPQLELFDSAGQAVGRSLGARSGTDLEALSGALLAGTPLPQLAGIGALSSLGAAATPTAGMADDLRQDSAAGPGSGSGPSRPSLPAPQAGPRSHG
ncbi:MAG: thioredoxin domain-containing protein [Synechococcaceae cyanobacterium]|nr:thioredoxin domain-containing protein [Synechococcaceae cyanobacterium]